MSSPKISPGSPRKAGKTAKSAAKLQFREELSEIAFQIKALHSLWSRFVSGGFIVDKKVIPMQYDIVLSDGTPFHREITKKDAREWAHQLSIAVKNLSKLAASTYKSQRTGAAGVTNGFSSPQRVTDELMNFMQNANFGTYFEGQVEKKTNQKGEVKRVVDPKTMRNTGEAINNYFYTLQQSINNVTNPTYRVIPPGFFPVLGSLHAAVTDMHLKTNIGGRLFRTKYMSASQEMRRYLHGAMQAAIDKDLQKVQDALDKSGGIASIPNPQDPRQVLQFQPDLNRIRDNLYRALDDPTFVVPDDARDPATMLSLNIGSKGFNIFNPNKFEHSHFSKIGAAAVVKRPANQPLFTAEDAANGTRIFGGDANTWVDRYGDVQNNLTAPAQANKKRAFDALDRQKRKAEAEARVARTQ